MPTLPTCVMKKETSQVTVNEVDREKWEADGWTYVSSNPAPQADEPKPEAPQGDTTPQEEGPTAPDDDQAAAQPINATASALALMEEEGVDPADVTGSGQDGKITKPDVEAYLAANG